MTSIERLPIIFIGDSDITHWSTLTSPKASVPAASSCKQKGTQKGNSESSEESSEELSSGCVVHATSGFTSIDVLNSIQTLEALPSTHAVIVCGENDLSTMNSGSGGSSDIPYIQSIASTILDIINTLLDSNTQSHISISHILFFGPKLEPWLSNDVPSMLSYCNLHNQISYSLKSLAPKVTYIDNLKRFAKTDLSSYDLFMRLKSCQPVDIRIETKYFKEGSFFNELCHTGATRNASLKGTIV